MQLFGKFKKKYKLELYFSAGFGGLIRWWLLGLLDTQCCMLAFIGIFLLKLLYLFKLVVVFALLENHIKRMLNQIEMKSR